MKTLAALLLAALVAPACTPALASPAVEVLQAAPALSGVIPSIVTQAWTTDTDGGATEIRCVGKTLFSFDCVNLSEMPVYVGDEDVTASTGIPHCTDTDVCTRSGWSYDARGTHMEWSGSATNNDAGPGVRCNLGCTPTP